MVNEPLIYTGDRNPGSKTTAEFVTSFGNSKIIPSSAGHGDREPRPGFGDQKLSPPMST